MKMTITGNESMDIWKRNKRKTAINIANIFISQRNSYETKDGIL